MKELISLAGGLRNSLKGLVEGLIVTAFLAAVYLGVCAVIPFR